LRLWLLYLRAVLFHGICNTPALFDVSFHCLISIDLRLYQVDCFFGEILRYADDPVLISDDDVPGRDDGFLVFAVEADGCVYLRVSGMHRCGIIWAL
jgi:hypothetical protein